MLSAAGGVALSRRGLWLGVLVLVILALVMLTLTAAGLKKVAEAEEAANLAVRAQSVVPIRKTAEPTQGMPGNVREWLEHLRRVEERKNQLHRRHVAEMRVFMAKFSVLGAAAGLLDGSGDEESQTNPVAPAQSQMSDLVGPWNQLIQQFQAVPPPEDCKELANTYLRALSEVPAMMGDIQRLLEGVSSGSPDAATKALETAYGIQDTSARSIDQHFAASDELLKQVCDKYQTAKWFRITPDLAGGLLAKPGP